LTGRPKSRGNLFLKPRTSQRQISIRCGTNLVYQTWLKIEPEKLSVRRLGLLFVRAQRSGRSAARAVSSTPQHSPTLEAPTADGCAL